MVVGSIAGEDRQACVLDSHLGEEFDVDDMVQEVLIPIHVTHSDYRQALGVDMAGSTVVVGPVIKVVKAVENYTKLVLVDWSVVVAEQADVHTCLEDLMHKKRHSYCSKIVDEVSIVAALDSGIWRLCNLA